MRRFALLVVVVGASVVVGAGAGSPSRGGSLPAGEIVFSRSPDFYGERASDLYAARPDGSHLRLLVRDGATTVIAVPYFLHTGRHVCDDIPTLLEQGSARHPGVEFLLAPFIGRSSRLTDLLAYRATEAVDETVGL